ncbi:hypothetical protein HanRHA438_Chr16g0740431 [Helianthus annuus]|nr:hypothetical protein HanIR_Chr16g0791871 [Helianthus annuus]KAJ0834149.1 hypothetical protein HanRHA438_Chr16g0740431 [Helianthus annuus]
MKPNELVNECARVKAQYRMNESWPGTVSTREGADRSGLRISEARNETKVSIKF